MTQNDRPSRDPLDRMVKVAWLLVVVEGVALLGAFYLIWISRADILGIFQSH